MKEPGASFRRRVSWKKADANFLTFVDESGAAQDSGIPDSREIELAQKASRLFKTGYRAGMATSNRPGSQ